MRRTTAIARIVVQATAQDKKAIAAKAKRLKLPISELMRRGAFTYEPNEADEELGALADSAIRRYASWDFAGPVGFTP
ncbi:MAG: hypothetical protein ACYC9Z_05090 [Casimicrobiaceae bacterium]